MKTFTKLLLFLLFFLAINEAKAQAPSAEFTYPRSGLTANFNITYPEANTTYAWDFGDGNTTTGSNPSYAYTTEGIYEATTSKHTQ